MVLKIGAPNVYIEKIIGNKIYRRNNSLAEDPHPCVAKIHRTANFRKTFK